MANQNLLVWDKNPTLRMRQLSAIIPPEYHARIPRDTTALEMTIAAALLDESFTIGIGQGPPLRGAAESTKDCMICLDPLARELTLRHMKPRVHAQGPDGCEHTWHFSCLIDWVSRAIKKRTLPRCPMDRVPLLSDDLWKGICQVYMIRYKPTHIIRYLHPDVVKQGINSKDRAREDTTIRFWDHADNRVQQFDHCIFQLSAIDIEYVLHCVSESKDAGFIRPSVIRNLPLDPATRSLFERYVATEIPGEKCDQYGRVFSHPAYPKWGYLHHRSGVPDHDDADVLVHEIILFPLTTQMYHLLARYLHGMAGDLLFIEMDRKGHPKPMIQTFSDQSVVNLQAELTVRKWMEDDHLRLGCPQDQAWYWPFPNSIGGVHVVASLPATNQFPGRAYLYRDLNLGQTNEVAFERLVTLQNHRAKTLYNNYLAMYLQNDIPSDFPHGFELPSKKIPERPGPDVPGAPRARSWFTGRLHPFRPENPDELFFGPPELISYTPVDWSVGNMDIGAGLESPKAPSIASPIRPYVLARPLCPRIPGAFDRYQNDQRDGFAEDRRLSAQRLAEQEAEAGRREEQERQQQAQREAHLAAQRAQSEARRRVRQQDRRAARRRVRLQQQLQVYRAYGRQRNITMEELTNMFRNWEGDAPTQGQLDIMVVTQLNLVQQQANLAEMRATIQSRTDVEGSNAGFQEYIDRFNAYEAQVNATAEYQQRLLRGNWQDDTASDSVGGSDEGDEIWDPDDEFPSIN